MPRGPCPSTLEKGGWNSYSPSYESLEGEGFRSDLPSAVFRASDQAARSALELWYTPAAPWQIGATVTLDGVTRDRRDLIMPVSTVIESFTPGLGVEVAREISPGTMISVWGGGASHSASALLPGEGIMGPVYNRVIAPELAAYASPAQPFAAGTTIRKQWHDQLAFVLGVRGDRRSGGDQPIPPQLGTDDRTAWNVSLRAIWRQ